jgi:uncharacterized protein (DUF433 family)
VASPRTPAFAEAPAGRAVRGLPVVRPGGDAVIKGTRVTLRTILASLAEGAAPADILRDFPSLTEADVRAAIAFAAASAQEDLPVSEIPGVR